MEAEGIISEMLHPTFSIWGHGTEETATRRKLETSGTFSASSFGRVDDGGSQTRADDGTGLAHSVRRCDAEFETR